MAIPLFPRWLRVSLGVGVAATVLAGSLLPPPPGESGALGPLGLVALDKWLHGLTYGSLTAVVAYAIPARSRLHVLTAVLVAVAFGLLVEGLQFGIPWRTFDPTDAAGNTIGALAVAAAWLLLGVGRRLEPPGDRSATGTRRGR